MEEIVWFLPRTPDWFFFPLPLLGFKSSRKIISINETIRQLIAGSRSAKRGLMQSFVGKRRCWRGTLDMLWLFWSRLLHVCCWNRRRNNLDQIEWQAETDQTGSQFAFNDCITRNHGNLHAFRARWGDEGWWRRRWDDTRRWWEGENQIRRLMLKRTNSSIPKLDSLFYIGSGNRHWRDGVTSWWQRCSMTVTFHAKAERTESRNKEQFIESWIQRKHLKKQIRFQGTNSGWLVNCVKSSKQDQHEGSQDDDCISYSTFWWRFQEDHVWLDDHESN